MMIFLRAISVLTMLSFLYHLLKALNRQSLTPKRLWWLVAHAVGFGIAAGIALEESFRTAISWAVTMGVAMYFMVSLSVDIRERSSEARGSDTGSAENGND